jgi:hypothetical protein
MPQVRSRSSRTSIEQEGRILLAIQAFKNKGITSIREITRRFDIPRSTLCDRLSGHTERSATRANSHKLSEIEEQRKCVSGSIISRNLISSKYTRPHVRSFDTIKNSFGAAGLVPFDPDRVILKAEYSASNPDPPHRVRVASGTRKRRQTINNDKSRPCQLKPCFVCVQ